MESNESRPNTTDPSLNPPDTLTPKGKHRSKKIDRPAQIRRYEQSVDDHSSDLIPLGPPTPGPNRKEKKKLIIGIDND